jgi:DNA-directed RNA polymerase specialized sigma54-like protein
MKIASLTEIKKELHYLSDKELIALLAEVSKFSSDNKLFLFFKLFGRDNPGLFTEMVKEELATDFQIANTRNYHYAKKSAQSIRRKLNKYLKFTKVRPIQIDLIVFFCEMLSEYGYLSFRHPVIENLYKLQLGKIEKIMGQLHEDHQFDYQDKVGELRGHIKLKG